MVWLSLKPRSLHLTVSEFDWFFQQGALANSKLDTALHACYGQGTGVPKETRPCFGSVNVTGPSTYVPKKKHHGVRRNVGVPQLIRLEGRVLRSNCRQLGLGVSALLQHGIPGQMVETSVN